MTEPTYPVGTKVQSTVTDRVGGDGFVLISELRTIIQNQTATPKLIRILPVGITYDVKEIEEQFNQQLNSRGIGVKLTVEGRKLYYTTHYS